MQYVITMSASQTSLPSQSKTYSTSYIHESKSSRSTRSKMLGTKIVILDSSGYQEFLRKLLEPHRKTKIYYKKHISKKSKTPSSSKVETNKTFQDKNFKKSCHSCRSTLVERLTEIEKQQLLLYYLMNSTQSKSFSNSINKILRELNKHKSQSAPCSSLLKSLNASMKNVSVQLNTTNKNEKEISFFQQSNILTKINMGNKGVFTKSIDSVKTKTVSSVTTIDTRQRSDKLCHTWVSRKNKIRNNTFCVMNLQVKHKLEPYECEPGVCVPGECDPYECEKRIRKRLMKMSGTMTSSGNTKTMSSETDRKQHNSKSQKNGRNQYAAPAHQNPLSPEKNKRALRIGSDFSINIEFSKDGFGNNDGNRCRQPDSPCTTTSLEAKQMKSKRTQGNKVLIQDGVSQSSAETRHKQSMTSRYKRCFCTLQLRKKAKQTNGIYFSTHKIPDKNVIEFKTTGQNTKKNKKPNIKDLKKYDICNLDPFECEPGVCIPGKCDPYVCLKRIQARNKGLQCKGIGTSTMSRSTAASMTDTRKNVKSKKEQRQANEYVPPRELGRGDSDGRTQAIRIGSNFSFNLEFCKDRSLGDGFDSNALHNDNGALSKKEKIQSSGKKNKSSNKTVQGTTNSRNQSNQFRASTKDGATGPSLFLKRCFCTAKLHSKAKYDGDGLTSTENNRNESQSKKKTYVEKRSQTKKMPRLEPYECEPGFCVPGQCDPYVCLERIKKRPGYLTKSCCTDQPSSKAINTKQKQNKICCKTCDTTTIQSPTQANNKDPSNRSIVKIGSNFSFNIEFYKEKPSDPYNAEIKCKPCAKNPTKICNKNISSCIPLCDSPSQVDVKKHHKGAGIRPTLKRCFCTLALHKPGQNQGLHLKIPQKEYADTTTYTPVSKVVPDYKEGYNKARPFKLEPYECEPGICIPGQCDPYECEKLIRNRLLRDVGTKTKNEKSKKKSKDTHTQSETKKKKMRKRNVKLSKKKEIIPPPPPPPPEPIRQGVRFGSNMSFNIEFYKEHTQGNDVLEQTAELTSQKIGSDHPTKKLQNEMSSGRDKGVDFNLQANRKDKNSKGSGGGMKRCFCTLKLQNNKYYPETATRHKTTTQNTSTEPVPKPQTGITIYKAAATTTPKPICPNIYPNLDPNECEPGFCVPGRCNPLKCLKRIEQRKLQSCNTKDGIVQTKKDTQSKACATTPNTPNKRCFCTAKLFRQQAANKTRTPAYTVGRVEKIETITPFTKWNYFNYHEFTSKANITEIYKNEHKCYFSYHIEEEEHLYSDIENFTPYDSPKYSNHEIKSLLIPVKQKRVFTVSKVNIMDKKVYKQPNKEKRTTDTSKLFIPDYSYPLHSKQSKNAQEGFLKKCKSERKPIMFSSDPRKSESMKIFKILSLTFVKNNCSMKYSPLQSGDAHLSTNRLSNMILHKNKLSNQVSKIDNLQNEPDSKIIVKKSIVESVKSIFKNKVSNNVTNLNISRIELKESNHQKKLSDNLVNRVSSSHHSFDIKKAAGDVTRLNSVKHNKNCREKQTHQATNKVDQKEVMQKKVSVGIKFSIKGKNHRTKVATFINKVGKKGR